MNLTDKLLLVWGCLLVGTSSFAQHTISGTLTTQSDQTPIAGGYVFLVQDGAVVNTAAANNEGIYRLTNVQDGLYAIEITCLGYKAVEDTLDVKGDCERNYVLEDNAFEIDEVSVTADQSQVVTRTATGKRFYLSSAAKKMRNPFQALQEIPELMVDVANADIKLLDGSRPLILINGNMINTGVNPISPSDIESVEIVQAVSARYLQEGITRIVNVKLKEDAKPYLWLEAATRHDIPIDHGLAVGYFEVGNPKFSLYGRLAYDYIYHDDAEATVNRSNTTYAQLYEQTSRKDAGIWLGELLFKFQPTKKDYLAVQVYGTSDKATTTQNAVDGTYTPQGADAAIGTDTIEPAPMVYGFTSTGINDSKILTSAAYYKHAFASNHTLEMRLGYNYNKNDYNVSQTDTYDEQTFEMATLYKSKRQSAYFNADYSRRFDNNMSLIAGIRSYLTFDEIHNMIGSVPVFNHRNYNQSVYIGFGNSYRNKLYYGGSVSLGGIFAKADTVPYRYIRPRASLYLTWIINDHNSLALNYRLSNTAPAVTYLNPYDTSTDSLVVNIGNPNLTPEMTHSLTANYTFNAGMFYLTPRASFTHITDVIEAYGYTDGNGIYYNTYANIGHYSQASAGADINYRFKWGRIYASGGWRGVYYEGQTAKNSGYVSGGFQASVKKFSFYGDISYTPRSYAKFAYTQYYRPQEAALQVNYNFTPDFYIAVRVEHVTGELRAKTVMQDGSYYSVTENRYTEKSFHPWILIRYTFRKNPERKHQLDKVLDSTEKGISLER